MANEFTIGKLAKACDVPTSTIRYYERRGLLSPNVRSDGNYRLYGPDALEQLSFIRAAQSTGFTLDDIEKLLSIRVGAKSRCEDVQALMEQRLAEVKARMAEMRKVERVLKAFLAKCQQSSRTGNCRVIDELSSKKSAKKMSSKAR